MKTYHQYQTDSKQAEDALKKVQSQKAKVEQQLSGKSLHGSRKFKKIEKLKEEVSDLCLELTSSHGWVTCLNPVSHRPNHFLQELFNNKYS